MLDKVKWGDPDPVQWTQPEPPEGGWVTAPCEDAESPWAFHNWQLEIEEGHARITCVDPCDVNPEHLDPQGKIPVCIAVADLYDPQTYGTPEPIPIRVEGIVEKYPGGPWGDAEYDFYINVHPASPKPRWDNSYTLNDGTVLRNVHHESADCREHGCVIHNSTDPHQEWELRWDDFGRRLYRVDEDGRKHEDKDVLAYEQRQRAAAELDDIRDQG